MRTYDFVSLQPHLTDWGHNKLYVDAFLGAMNERDFNRHPLDPDPTRRALVFGSRSHPCYNDGRITTRRVSWVYAIKLDNMPPDAVAMVYFTTAGGPDAKDVLDPIGYLTLRPE